MTRLTPHRRRLTKIHKINTVHKIIGILKFIPFFLLTISFLGIVLLIYSLKSRIVLSKPINFALVYKDGVSFLNYDSNYREMLIVHLDGNIIMDTAYSMGKYPLKNIFSLGINEKEHKDLFKKTLIKNFHIPITGVLDCRSSSGVGVFKINSLFTCRSNGSIADLIYAVYAKFSSGGNITYKSLEDYDVNFEDSGLSGKYLSDSKIFDKIEFDFSTDLDINDVVNVEITAPSNTKVPQYFYDLIKYCGGRIVNLQYVSGLDGFSGCKITGGNVAFVKYLRSVFGCKVLYLDDKDSVIKLIFSEDVLDGY